MPCVFIVIGNILERGRYPEGIIKRKFVMYVRSLKHSVNSLSKIYSSRQRRRLRPSTNSSLSVLDRLEPKIFPQNRVRDIAKGHRIALQGRIARFRPKTLSPVLQAAWRFLGLARDLSETGYPSVVVSHMTDAEHHISVSLKNQLFRCIILEY